MATRNLSFAAAVDEWTKQSEQRMERVFKESTKRVIQEVRKPVAKGGNMPVDTGFLRNSLVASTDGPTPIDPKAGPADGASYDKAGDVLSGDVSLIIAGAKIGQTIWACFTAAYARRQEYGFTGEDALGRTYNQAGRGFVRLAAQKWQRIVESVVKELKDREGA